MEHTCIFNKLKALSASCFVGIMSEKKLSEVFFSFERIKYLDLVELGATLQTECSKEKADLKEGHEILFSRVFNFRNNLFTK